MWLGQREVFQGRYRFIAPDVRGHGESRCGDPGHSIDDMADDVIETLGALGVNDSFILGGLSMGGYVSLSIAARYPNRLRGLILMDTKAVADTPEAARGRDQAAQAIENAGDLGLLVWTMLPKLFSPRTRERDPHVVATIENVIRSTSVPGAASTLRALGSRPDRTPMLGSITVPTLVLCGAEDVISPPDEMRAMARSIPNSTFVEIPDAGHMAPVENPAAVNEALRSYLDNLI
jgi:pimeloyl-ACP methyl ester carboxylesterase